MQVYVNTDFLPRNNQYSGTIELTAPPNHSAAVGVQVFVPRVSQDEASEMEKTIRNQKEELRQLQLKVSSLMELNVALEKKIEAQAEEVKRLELAEKELVSQKQKIADLKRQLEARDKTLTENESELKGYRLIRDLGSSAINSIVDGIQGLQK